MLLINIENIFYTGHYKIHVSASLKVNEIKTAMIYINMAQGTNPDEFKHSFKEW